MSVTQDAASPVAGKGWRGLSGWGKVATGAAAVVVLGVAVYFPSLFGGGSGQKLPAKADVDGATLEPFKPPPRPAFGEGGASIGGQQGRVRTHRLPPPLEIGSYVILPQLQQANAQQARVAQANYGAGMAQQGGMNQGAGSQPVVVPAPTTPPPPPAPGSLEAQTSGATALQTSSASILAHPDYTITAGTKIPCLPVEAADSSMGGFYTCRVPEWIRGTTQQRGLLPPGTLIFGQVKKGLEDGQERLGILYTRIQTAGDNFLIRLSAPAADAMGRAGIDGDLHTFFWDKVGDVALYALIDGLQGALTQGAPAALSTLGGSNGNSFLNIGAGGSGQSLAAMEMQRQINRPPVLRRDQALPLEVSVGSDLDFFAACQQRRTVSAMACPPQ